MAEKPTPSPERAEKPTRSPEREPSSGARASARSFISRIVSDPKTPPAVYLLCGYPGDSAKEGSTRFYLSPNAVHFTIRMAAAESIRVGGSEVRGRSL